MKDVILIIETLSSGIGFEIIEEALRLDQAFIFVSLNKERTQKLIPEKLKNKFAIHYCDYYSVEFLENFIAQFKDIRLCGVICMLDDLLEVTAIFAAKNNLPFTNSKTIPICTNKKQTRLLCLKEKIGSPIFEIIQLNKYDLSQWNQYPAVIKPLSSAGSMDIKRVNNKEELTLFIEQLAATKKYDELLIETLLLGPIFSIEGFVFKNNVRILGLSDRTFGSNPYFVEKGMNFPANIGSKLMSEINHFAHNLIKKIGFDYGFFHIEIIIDQGTIKLIEFNPRIGGRLISLMIGKAYGINFYEEYFKLAKGIQPNFPHLLKGCSTQIIFPEKSGKLKGIDLEDLKYFKDLDRVILNHTIKTGDQVSPPIDFRGHLLITLCVSESTELAHATNRAILSTIKINIQND